MAIRKTKRQNKETGKKEKSESWYIFFHDHHRREHSFAAGTDKGEAVKLEGRIREVVQCRKDGFYPPDVSGWLDALPGGLRSKLAKWDLLNGGRVAAGVPLSKHLSDWKEHLISSGVTAKQAEQQCSRAQRIFDKAGFKYLPEIIASKTMNVIDRLAKLVKCKDEKTGKIEGVATDKNISSISKLHHLRAIKQFSKWLKTDGRAAGNPLESLSVKGAVVENKRRSLTEAEIIYLLDYVSGAGVVRSLSGTERALTYRLAIETGLRASELASLKRTSFDFDGLSVKIAAEHSKNRKAATLPIKAATMEKIKEYLSSKLPTALAFGLKVNHTALMIQEDLEEARKHWIQAVKDNPDEHQRRNDSDFLKIKTEKGKIDFHSLRHTFGTMLAGAGTHPKTAMELMRHSKIELTMGIYTHAQDEKMTQAIDNLPDFEQKQVSAMTGTDDICVDAIGQNQAEKNTPKNTPNRAAKPCITSHNLAQVNDDFENSKNGLECNETGVLTHSKDRRRWDSNPRNNGFANRRLRPLGYAAERTER